MQNQEESIKKLEAQLNKLISIVSEQLKDVEICSNDEVVEIELCFVEVKKLKAHGEKKEEPQIQKENDELCESLKANIEGDHAEDFSSYLSKDEVNNRKIKLVNEACYVVNCESDKQFDDKGMK